MHKQLLAVRKACEITHTESLEGAPTQKTENGTVLLPPQMQNAYYVLVAIKLETLDELAKNANEDIRNT